MGFTSFLYLSYNIFLIALEFSFLLVQNPSGSHPTHATIRCQKAGHRTCVPNTYGTNARKTLISVDRVVLDNQCWKWYSWAEHSRQWSFTTECQWLPTQAVLGTHTTEPFLKCLRISGGQCRPTPYHINFGGWTPTALNATPLCNHAPLMYHSNNHYC